MLKQESFDISCLLPTHRSSLCSTSPGAAAGAAPQRRLGGTGGILGPGYLVDAPALADSEGSERDVDIPCLRADSGGAYGMRLTDCMGWWPDK
mmetsp:Transcript_56441/g.146694  ORF Transcript_56441/g.146694 Transcript_56441/m.146694 type:complete len:93 (+) Transcript_56441:143-421(+)